MCNNNKHISANISLPRLPSGSLDAVIMEVKSTESRRDKETSQKERKDCTWGWTNNIIYYYTNTQMGTMHTLLN